jgi:hypothetical protein
MVVTASAVASITINFSAYKISYLNERYLILKKKLNGFFQKLLHDKPEMKLYINPKYPVYNLQIQYHEN